MQNNSFSVQLSESIFVLLCLTFWCQNGTDINHCKTVFGFQHQRKADATVGLFIIHLYSYKNSWSVFVWEKLSSSQHGTNYSSYI